MTRTGAPGAVAATVAVVGGGRWGRQYLSVLCGMPLPWRLVLVSRHAGAAVETLRDAQGRPVAIVPDLDALLRMQAPAAAIVVNAARSHADATLRLLDAGVAVLVEKPAAPDAATAASLVQAARRRGVSLVPALSYLHCAYLERFADVVRAARAPVARLALEWADPASETRHGARKDYDRGIGIALDVMPHVWSMLSTILPRAPVSLEACDMARGGRQVTVGLRCGAVACEVSIEREAAARRRFIGVAGGPSIDFSTEPGTIRSDGMEFTADAQWSTRADRPLRRQVEAFLQTLGRPPDEAALADLCASVELAVACDARVKEMQREMLAGRPLAADDGDTLCGVRELLAPRLVELGRLAAGDRAALDDHVQALRALAAARGAPDWQQALALEGA